MCAQNEHNGKVSMGNHYMSNRTFNLLAAGSIPARPTKNAKGFEALCLEALFTFLANSRQICTFRAQKAHNS